MGFALRKDNFPNIYHEAVPKPLRKIFDHYEASYYEFVLSLTKENPDENELLLGLTKFRLFKGLFYREMLKFGRREGLVTSLDEGEKFLSIVRESRFNLLDSFPDYSDPLSKCMQVPVAFLPFIKLSEDPFSEILGQTIKFNEDECIIAIKSGTGRELPTTMHEHLHAAVRGLPGVFEEGFCRYALQSRGFEESEILKLGELDTATLLANFSGIFYPNIFVNILAQAEGDKKILDGFFHKKLEGLDSAIKKCGKSMEDCEKAFKDGNNRQALENISKLKEALKHSISADLSAMVDKIIELASLQVAPAR